MSKEAISNPGLYGAIGSAAFGILKTVDKKKEVDNEPSEVSLDKFVKVPDYNEKLGFIHHVVRDLELVFETIPTDYQKLVIFIDDLDRCSPMKVAQVIEGVNLFLAREFPSCIFVIGIDTEMVAAALQVAHKEVVSELPSYSIDSLISYRVWFNDIQVKLLFCKIYAYIIHYSKVNCGSFRRFTRI